MLYLYKRESCCVSHILYIVHAQCQVFGESVRLHLIAPYKSYKGHHDEPCIACLSLAPERMSDMERGKGLSACRAHLNHALLTK